MHGVGRVVSGSWLATLTACINAAAFATLPAIDCKAFQEGHTIGHKNGCVEDEDDGDKVPCDAEAACGYDDVCWHVVHQLLACPSSELSVRHAPQLSGTHSMHMQGHMLG